MAYIEAETTEELKLDTTTTRSGTTSVFSVIMWLMYIVSEHGKERVAFQSVSRDSASLSMVGHSDLSLCQFSNTNLSVDISQNVGSLLGVVISDECDLSVDAV